MTFKLTGKYGLGGSWLSVDKFAHFGLSYVICDLLLSFGLSTLLSGVIAFGVGFSKDVYDGFKGSGFSIKDGIANTLGILLCLCL